MTASLTGYYHQAGLSIGRIRSEDVEELGKDYMAVAATGAAIAFLGTAVGGLDKEIFGVTVPVDGLFSVALGAASLKVRGEPGNLLKVASIAAGGSAAVRTFEGFFKRGFGVKGDFTDLQHDRLPGYEGTYGPTFGFGGPAQDRLVVAARYL
jgi:hypothetical protein